VKYTSNVFLRIRNKKVTFTPSRIPIEFVFFALFSDYICNKCTIRNDLNLDRLPDSVANVSCSHTFWNHECSLSIDSADFDLFLSWFNDWDVNPVNVNNFKNLKDFCPKINSNYTLFSRRDFSNWEWNNGNRIYNVLINKEKNHICTEYSDWY